MEAPLRLLGLSGIVFTPLILILRLAWRALTWRLIGAGLCFGGITLAQAYAAPDQRVWVLQLLEHDGPRAEGQRHAAGGGAGQQPRR